MQATVRALGLDGCSLDPGQEFFAKGNGCHLGMPVQWELRISVRAPSLLLVMLHAPRDVPQTMVALLAFQADGGMREHLVTPELNHTVGHNGEAGALIWEARAMPALPSSFPNPGELAFACKLQVDSSGISRELELDDHEAVLLAMWTRSSLWTRPFIRHDRSLEDLELAALLIPALSPPKQVPAGYLCRLGWRAAEEG